jgi:cyclopropane fatty-acyl-phospholipid synthase-like methyltransferase
LEMRGRMAGLGTGTGYEIKIAAGTLPEWEIESYDIDPSAEAEARQLLQHFGVRVPIRFGRELPIDTPDDALLRRYDAIVACEVLEHLPDPARALRTMREYLTDRGRMFVTMAINIAQEDHIFLYPDLASCRRQLEGCSMRVIEEWVTPQTLWPPPADREKEFKRGNYVAVVERMS